jgi:tRNA pseudouridine55 synthase
VPSSVSAIKVDGRRAYALVRAGAEVALPPRPVLVSAFDVLARRGADLDVAVECSSGTYVRALARDLGAALGVGGHLTALRRTRVGPFTLAHARTLEALGTAPSLSLTLDEAVAVAFPRRDADPAEAADLAHGRPLPPAGVEGVQGVFGPNGHVLALVRDRDGRARPVVVLAPA